MAGLHQTFRSQPLRAKIVALIWVVYPLVFYIVQFDRRYRHPIEWTFLLMAAQAFVVFGHLDGRSIRTRAVVNPG